MKGTRKIEAIDITGGTVNKSIIKQMRAHVRNWIGRRRKQSKRHAMKISKISKISTTYVYL